MLIITRLFKNYREEGRGKIERRYSEVCRSGNVYARVKWSKWWLVTLSNSSFSQPWTILQCGRELRNRVPRHASRILTACSIHYSKPSAFAFSFFLFLSLTIAPPKLGKKKFDRAEIEILSLKIESAFWLKRAFFKLVVLHGGFYI